MAEVKQTTTVILTEQEPKLVEGLLYPGSSISTGWNSVAADLAISLEPHFDESELPQVDFSFEDRAGNQIEMCGLFVTVEVNDNEGDFV